MSLEVTLADDGFPIVGDSGRHLSLAFDDEAEVGKILDERYELTKLLGRGGMGAVYRANDQKTGRQVAVKCLRKSRADDDHISRRMLREARAVAAIGHPGIVDLFDVGKDNNGKWFVVFELLEGRDVDRVIEDGDLSLGEVWRIGVEMLDALDAAHDANIVHRDLKPANLFLHQPEGADDWTLKLLDFGIAKQTELSGETKLTTTGIVVGTPQYMSPEQARGKTLDGRADIWSAACVLFRLLTGRVPFHEDNFADLMARMLTEEPPRLGELYPEIPECLRLAVDGALHRRPERRWATAGEMRDVLLDGMTLDAFARKVRPAWNAERVPPPLGVAASTARMPSSRPPPTVATPATGRRWRWLMAGIGLSLLSGMGGYAAVLSLRDPPVEAPAPEPIAEVSEPQMIVPAVVPEVAPAIAEPVVEIAEEPVELPATMRRVRTVMQRVRTETESLTEMQPAELPPTEMRIAEMTATMRFSVARDYD